MQSKKNRIDATYVEGLMFLLGSLLLGAYSLALHVGSKSKWSLSPYLFPLVVASCLFLLSLSLLAEGAKEKKGQKIHDTLIPNAEYSGRADQNGNSWMAFLIKKSMQGPAIFALFTLLYIILVSLVGFIGATCLFLIASFYYLKEKKLWLILVLSVAFPLVVYVLFGMLLHVMLP